MIEMHELILSGLMAAIQPLNILVIILGLAIGMLAGILPGVTMVNAVVLVLPFTYFMDLVPGLMLLIGIYCGGTYAGTITGILFNIPGDPMNVPQTLEGYALNKKKGLGSKALGVAVVVSAIGGVASGLVMTFASMPLVKVVLKLNQADFFTIVLFGLCCVTALSAGSKLNSFLSLLIGMFLATVGIDHQFGTFRFNFFGLRVLESGFDFIIVMIGLFAIGEVLDQMGSTTDQVRTNTEKVKVKTTIPGIKDMWVLRNSIARGLGVGSVIGFIPGAGATISAFLAYGIERQVRGRIEEFGSGSMAGLTAPETAANASTGGAIMSLLVLGIPGSAATAVMMAAFMMKGINPGPLLFVKDPQLVFTIFMGFLLTNLLMTFLGVAAAKVFAQLLRVPAAILGSFIVIFCSIGAYALRNDIMDIWIAMIFGIVGYVMRRMNISVAPLILGLILGPLSEQFFRSSMAIHNNRYWVFFTRPVSCVILMASLGILIYSVAKGEAHKVKEKDRADSD